MMRDESVHDLLNDPGIKPEGKVDSCHQEAVKNVSSETEKTKTL